MPIPDLDQLKELKKNVDDPEKIRNNKSFLLHSLKEKLEAGNMRVCHVVEALEQTLTHPNPAERALGTKFLVDVLQSLSPFRVTCEELKFLAAFFIDRLKDHHSVVPHVFIGMMALVKQGNISAKDVRALIQALFTEVQCQSHATADRRNIYNLLKFCILTKAEEMKGISTEFVLGFISAMEGEKDPRNLLLLFSLVPYITQRLSLDSFAEDLFEVISAYFPIDFIPPVYDPYGILPEDLILGLRSSLASTDAFAPFCLPLLQEKLDSDVIATKLDALRTLEACCESYSAASLRPHVLILWPSLRREVVEGWHAEVEAAACSALRGLVAALETGLEDERASLLDSSKKSVKEGLIQLGLAAMAECVPHLSSPEQRLMNPSSQLLLAVSAHSHCLTRMVCEKVLPQLVDQFGSKTEPIARKNTLIALSRFLDQGAKFGIYDEEPFSEWRSSCLEVLLEGSTSTDLSVKETALAGLAVASAAFSDAQMARVCRQMVQDVLHDDTQRKTLSSLTANALICFGRAHPSVIVQDVLPNLLRHLKKGQIEDEKRVQVLDTVAALCCSSSAPLEKALPVLWEEAHRCLMEERSDTSVQYFACIKKMIAEGEVGGPSSTFLRQEWHGVLRCQLLLASSAIRSDLPLDLVVPVLEEVSDICRGLVSGRGEDTDLANALVGVLLGKRNVQDLWSLMVGSLGETWLTEHDLSLLLRLPEEVAENSKRSPMAVYCLRGLISVGGGSFSTYSEDLLALLLRWSVMAEDERFRESAASFYASQILSISSESEVGALLESLEAEFCENEMTVHPSPPSVRFLGWVVKSLIMRAYSGDLPWIQKLEKLLLSTDVGQSASECYAFLLKDVPSMCVLSAQGKTLPIRMLYKQRFFERRIDALVKQFREAEGKGKMNTLLAVSHFLPCLSHAVLKGHLQKLLPVLIQGLTCGDAAVTSGTVETLSSLLRHNVEAVMPHVSTLAPPLLAMTALTPITVRVKALECLETLAELPSPVVVPLKQQVVHGLRSSLDDRKRVVRRAASNAKCAWVLV